MKRMRNYLYMRLVFAVAVILIATIILGSLYFFNSNKQKKITSYDECVAAGGVILESFPPQCKDKNGNTFTMKISDDTPDTGSEITFTQVAKGQHTSNKFDNLMYPVLTKEEWDTMWTSIDSSLKEGPAFDFDKETAIALFIEQQPTGGYDLTVQKVTESDRIVVYVEKKVPGLGCMSTESLTSPYQVIKINKTNKPIIFKTEQKIVNCFS